MAGTVVLREEIDPKISKVVFEFTAHTTGAADKTTVNAYSGKVLHAVIRPNKSTTQPTNEFDVAVTDEDGVDLLNGYGADLSNANDTVITKDLLGACANDQLTLAVTNAGSGKTGTVTLYLR